MGKGTCVNKEGALSTYDANGDKKTLCAHSGRLDDVIGVMPTFLFEALRMTRVATLPHNRLGDEDKFCVRFNSFLRSTCLC